MAKRIAGIRYASDLPTPVPASTARCSRFCNARATATAICCCCGRNSKFFARDRMPVGEKISSTCATKSAPAGWGSTMEIISSYNSVSAAFEGRQERSDSPKQSVDKKCQQREPAVVNVVGTRLKNARDAKGLSLRKFAEEVGEDFTLLARIERGDRFP